MQYSKDFILCGPFMRIKALACCVDQDPNAQKLIFDLQFFMVKYCAIFSSKDNEYRLRSIFFWKTSTLLMSPCKSELFNTQPRVLMTLKKNYFENFVGNRENVGYLHFLLFPPCFLPYQRQKSLLESHFFFLV